MRFCGISARWPADCLIGYSILCACGRYACGLYLMVFSVQVHAAQYSHHQPLPDPLSLEQALALSSMAHPDVELASERIEAAYARQDMVEADTGIQVNLDLNPQQIKLSKTGETTGDSYARLSVRKKLYDFGYSESLAMATDAEVSRYQHQFTQSVLQHRINIIRDFYAVILADLRYTFENEEMTQLYVKFDRLRDRHSLGMVTETLMLKAKNRYSEQQDIRSVSDHQRRIARQRLALSLNRPEELPGELITPNFSNHELDIPEFQALMKKAIKLNPGLQALRQNVKASQEKLQAKKTQFNPSISAVLDLNDYERNLSSRADVRVGLQLNVPIYLGGKKTAVSRLAYAEFLTSQTQLRRAEFDLREKLLELLTRLNNLKVERQTSIERVTLQDQVLDRQRALYELEIRASMGSSMANLTRAQWLEAKTRFDIVLTVAQIAALLGKPFTTDLSENGL